MVININTPSKQYNVYAERGALSLLPEVLGSLAKGARAAILTDDKVDALHGNTLTSVLDKAGVIWHKHIIPNGERSKTPETLFTFLEFMAESGITRSDIVIALGGGVVGDIAGFAAAIYQRGIDFIQIPTTLLAMTDSSVGGKTAVDLRAGKNLAGAFHQPLAVICDLDLLSTLSQETFRDGCAEIIKYGFICDCDLYTRLSEGIDTCLEHAIIRSIEIKRDLVTADELDRGQRALLNYGHTFGHAIEKLSDFKLTHGQGVAKGMLIAARAARELGLCDIVGKTKEILTDYTFDLSVPFSAREIAMAASGDKKASGSSLTLVLPERMGKCVLYPIKTSELEGLLTKCLEK